jgi:phage terminase large subunit-like protein
MTGEIEKSTSSTIVQHLPKQWQYPGLLTSLKSMEHEERQAIMRTWARTDLYFLLRYLFNRPDLEHPWLFDRCREVQESPDGHLDLWSREHYKSTIITYAKTIQDILASHGDDPLPEWGGIEATFGIFSHTRPIAKAFLKQIQRELENNQVLKDLFPDVLYQDPKHEAPQWSEDGGITVKRGSNPKESTVEAWGVVEGQPVSKHFLVLVFDDMVTKASTTSTEMIEKTTEHWELALSLGSTEQVRKRYIGTRYHMNDSYRVIMNRQAAKPRIYPATDNGELDGKAVYWSQGHYEEKVREYGSFTASCQLLQNPLAEKHKGFNRADLRFYDRMGEGGRGNRIIIVDPANEKKKKSDYTSMGVIELGQDRNFYLIDGVRDKLNLTERTDTLMHLHRTWFNRDGGRIVGVYYEKYGKDSDTQHIRYVQESENYRFDIQELGGSMSKTDRILRLQPQFEQHRWWFPHHIYYQDHQGKDKDLIEQFLVEEYDCFPVPVHDDFLDMLARVNDIELLWPKPVPTEQKRDRYQTIGGRASLGMGA